MILAAILVLAVGIVLLFATVNAILHIVGWVLLVAGVIACIVLLVRVLTRSRV